MAEGCHGSDCVRWFFDSCIRYIFLRLSFSWREKRHLLSHYKFYGLCLSSICVLSELLSKSPFAVLGLAFGDFGGKCIDDFCWVFSCFFVCQRVSVWCRHLSWVIQLIWCSYFWQQKSNKFMIQFKHLHIITVWLIDLLLTFGKSVRLFLFKTLFVLP